MNSEGVVLEYSSEPFHKSDEIIAGINAHYGTSFYQEDDIDKDFTIGETMPNWNAYEKIEMEQIKVAIDAGSAQYIFGYIKGSECAISVTSSNYCNISNNEGKIIYPQGGPPFDDNIKNMVRYKLSTYNVDNVTSIIESYEQYQVIDNWDEYTIIQ